MLDMRDTAQETEAQILGRDLVEKSRQQRFVIAADRPGHRS